MKTNLKDLTKKQLGIEESEISMEMIVASALVRIADASEISATNFVQMQKDLDWYKSAYRDKKQEIEVLNKKLSASKGHNTRLRKKLI